MPTTLAGHRGPLVGSFFSESSTTAFTVSTDGAVFTWEWKEEVAKVETEGDDTMEIDKPTPRKLVDGLWKMKTKVRCSESRRRVCPVCPVWCVRVKWR